jgi:hypothetical protein
MSLEYASVRSIAASNAVQEVGMNIREIGGENRGPRVDIFSRTATVGVSRDPSVPSRDWCGMFIYYCYRQAAHFCGMHLPFRPDEDLWSGEKLERWAQRHPDTIVSDGLVQPGDIYVAHNYHIGMVTGLVGNDPTLFRSVDGNQSTANSGHNAVTENVRHLSGCRVIVRI